MLINAIRESSPALLFTSALSFHEFIEQNVSYAGLLRACYHETRLPAKEQLLFSAYPDSLNLMVIAAEDAPDTIMVLPILQRIAEASPRLDLHIVCADDDLSRLWGLVDDADLPDDLDELDTPLLLVFDEEWTYQASWGPRPQAAEEPLDAWLEQHPAYEELGDSDDDAAQIQYGELLHELTYEMRVWYNGDLRTACAVEIADLLQSIQIDSDGDADTDTDTNTDTDTDNDDADSSSPGLQGKPTERHSDDNESGDNESHSRRRELGHDGTTQDNDQTSSERVRNEGGRPHSRTSSRRDDDRQESSDRRNRRQNGRNESSHRADRAVGSSRRRSRRDDNRG